MNKNTFQDLIIKSASKETSAVPEYWTKDNPTIGHCAVVALYAQQLFGGQLLRDNLEATPFKHLRSHYWNLFPDGKEYDFTKLQFGNEKLVLNGVTRKRADVLKNKETAHRYEVFIKNVSSLTS